MILNSPYITGSLTVTGDATIAGNITVTGSLSGTATSASYAYTASSAINATSASKAISSSYADTASFANNFTVIGNLTVFGTQSVQYITSSQLNISDNVITVNVASPGVRFGGLSVFDSGSLSSEATASLFWDSQNNHWIYQRESGSTYDGGMLISGPRNAAGLGNEQGTTNCMLLVGQGGDHLTSSLVYHDSSRTCFYGNALFVSSSGNIGIGTTSAFGKLSVVGTDNTTISSALWGSSTGAGLVSSVYNSSQTANSVAGIRLITRDSGASVWNMYNISTGGDSGDLAFGNGAGGAGTEKLRITNSGLVGIGTCSPGNKLAILAADETTNPTLGTNAGKFGIFNGTGAGTYGMIMGVINNGNTYLQVQRIDGTATAYNLLLQPSGGNVGIGIPTANPTALLTVAGTSDLAWSASTSKLQISRSGTVARLQNYDNGSASTLALQFDGGYLGIGNASPVSRLSVNNAVQGAILPYINATSLSYNSDGISVAGSNTNNTNVGNGLTLYNNVASVGAYSPVIAFSSMTSGGAYNSTYAFITGIYQGVGGDSNWAKGALMFGTATSYGATERMRITDGGDLFIANTANQVAASSGPGGWSYSANSYQAVATNSGVSLYLNRIATDGAVLVFRKNGTDVGSISTNSNSLPSDLNFKKNISNLDLGLNLVTKLRAVSYNHKIDDDDTALSTGFIAQEFEQSLTELGIEENKYHILQHKPNEDETQSQYWLDYTKIIPVLVKAIQEQQCTINTLKTCIGIA
jgi:hypothetical protein